MAFLRFLLLVVLVVGLEVGKDDATGGLIHMTSNRDLSMEVFWGDHELCHMLCIYKKTCYLLLEEEEEEVADLKNVDSDLLF